MRGNLATRSTRQRPFDPRSILGLVGWYDANHRGVLTADGVAFQTWSDLSTGALGTSPADLAQATAGFRPVLKLDVRNGLHVARYDGVDDFHLGTATQLRIANGSDKPLTVYWCGAVADLTTTPTLWSFTNSASDTPVLRLTATAAPNWQVRKVDDAGVGVNATYASGLADNGWHVISVAHTGIAVDITVDGVADSAQKAQDVGSMTNNRFNIAAKAGLTTTQPCSCDVGEVLVYNTYHDAAERHTIERYLGRKWGVFL